MKKVPSIIDILRSHWSKSTIMEILKMASHPIAHVQYRHFKSRFDRMKASREITAIILSVDPNHIFDHCLNSVKNQSIRPCAIEVVRNVSPVSKARQNGLEKVQTPYYVNVDGDMVLSSSCFERLYFTMTRVSKCAEAEASLVDPLLGIIKGVKMYRTRPVKAIGFHPLADDKTEDRFMSRKLSANGFLVCDTHTIEGIHHPVYEPLEAFWKFRFISEKLRYYKRPSEAFLDYVRHLNRCWQRTGDSVYIYALAGLFDGMQTDNVESVLSYEDREKYESFLKFHEYMQGMC